MLEKIQMIWWWKRAFQTTYSFCGIYIYTYIHKHPSTTHKNIKSLYMPYISEKCKHETI